MIRAEYQRFLQTLNADDVPEGVCKISNLMLAHMDVLIPLGTHQGQRVKYLVPLAQISWDALSPEIQPLPEQTAQQTSPVTQLKSLVVGPFRGFSRQETFDLANRLVLIYGPNGTGKSSFCEALEYGLLGNVAEAESKRFRDQREYLKNAHVDLFTEPEIIGVDDQGEVLPVEANEELYRFCFVEKNRIDTFSRIAAQAPAKQIELISTLFGLDSFNEFVRNFTTEIDDRYIDLVGAKAKQLNEKRQALAGAQQQIATNTEELQKLATEEQTLGNQYRERTTFSQMVLEVNGNEQNTGAIQKLQTELQQPIASKSNLTSAALETLGNSIATSLSLLVPKQQELGNASQQVSFKQLYEAVTEVQPSSPEHCPACKTPLHQVTINPYIHAGEELENLQHLAVLQQSVQELMQNITEWLRDLSQIVSTCVTQLFQGNVLSNLLIAQRAQADITWWNSLRQPLQDGLSPWQHIQAQVKQLEEIDIAIDQFAQIRLAKQTALIRLREFAQQITILQTRRNTAEQAITKAQQTITNFFTENAQLIADAEAEKAILVKNQSIAISYSDFVARLDAYKNSLPSQLVADLGDIVVTLYNAFNRNDASGDLLAKVKLPLAQNQHLKISFQSNPQKFFDALHVLSEGHIRCMGLSILLAKNFKENCPILIFDDPVNAIDDDHRDSIRKTLFEDQYFASKQVILTCHGEEFFKDIHNLLPAQISTQSKSFAFLPRLDPHIRVDFNCAPRNYIVSARQHYDCLEIRGALAKSRQALESLTKDKVWKYVHRYGDGYLSIKLSSAKASIELRNLTEQLKKQISRGDFTDPNKNTVLDPINDLLGPNGNSREWRYLNKGTHDEQDRTEFDRQTVSEMITALETLDQAL
jgi:energy-coupling factor transporter ATP-binding protein EcfA2